MSTTMVVLFCQSAVTASVRVIGKIYLWSTLYRPRTIKYNHEQRLSKVENKRLSIINYLALLKCIKSGGLIYSLADDSGI